MKRVARTRLVEARKRRQWSQRELADHIGTTQHNVSRWEAGFTTPGPYFRAKLCALFEMSAQELELFDINPPPSDEKVAELAESASTSVTDAAALWTVPYLRNPHFTGREELLEQLDQQFAVPGDDEPMPLRQAALTQPQAIKGLGGMGKTQIAVEYAYRARERGRYTHILWINAASEEAIITSFGALAGLLPVEAASAETDQRKLVVAVIRWLEQCKERWLLIFDNADEMALLESYLPHQGNGHLLFTTRAHAVGAFASALGVEKMGLVEGTLLLLHRARREHASDEERNEAANIVIALDGFPLALDQAGAYIEETGCSFGDYLQTYQQHHQVLLARRGRQATNYPDPVATTWSLSFTQIEQSNPAAVELLHLCAFLAPDAIPEELLTEGAAQWPAALRRAVADGLAFNLLLEALLSFSLIKRQVEERVLSLHRLVQVVQRDTMGWEEQRQWAERVVRAVHGIFPVDPKGDEASWPVCLRYLEQVQVCETLIQQYQLVFPEAAELLDRTGIYLSEHASYTLAEPLYQRVLQLREQFLGPEHPEVARALLKLANVHREWRNSEQAELLFERAIRIQEQALGPEHPDLASSLNGLANLYRREGRNEQAELLFERAIRIQEQALGPEHPDLASSLNGLAVLYRLQSRYEQAEPLFKRAIHIQEQALGPEHSDLALSLNNLANLYYKQGRYEQAEFLYQRAQSIWVQRLGPEHPEVARIFNNLASIYSIQGKYAEAEPLYQRTLLIWEQRLGPEHPSMVFPLEGLANLYCNQGNYEEAEPLYQRALRIFELRLETEHAQMATLLTGLASLYREQGKYEEAAELYQRALQIRKARQGEHHSETAETLHNFALLREAQGKQQEAIALYQRALAIRGQLLGETHPATMATRTRYLALLQTMERMEEANELL
ncbi:MAG TPA: FxSxx-COOH system tetratricopeptide repeat protein [Ktedonobacteraceae bacterium]|nr:FxSxx-COOH system tetratricopeptide repeat protein [Ktedonobacteraceae bacterium]